MGHNAHLAARFQEAIIPGFTFTRSERVVEKPEKPKPKKKRESYPSIPVDERHGEGWPRPAGFRAQWTGWLTYREYNVIEFRERFEIDNIHKIGQIFGIKSNSAERMYHNMTNAGILEGPADSFRVTPMAKILWDMTDQFILELDLGDDEEEAA